MSGGIEHKKVGQELAVYPVALGAAVFYLAAEVLPKLLVAIAVVLQKLQKVSLYLLFKVLRDELKLPVVLQKLAGDVEREVGGIDDAADELEILGKKVGAFVHNKNAAGIELESALVIAGIIIVGRLRRDEHQRLILYGALGGDVDRSLRRLEVAELLLVKLRILLVGNGGLGLLPDRLH